MFLFLSSTVASTSQIPSGSVLSATNFKIAGDSRMFDAGPLRGPCRQGILSWDTAVVLSGRVTFKLQTTFTLLFISGFGFAKIVRTANSSPIFAIYTS
jgi:hypothetical protein